MNPTSSTLANARTLLFVPGNRPERFEKALLSGADAVVLDLEDAVPMQEKPAARMAIEQAWPRLRQAGVPVVLRINAADQAMGEEDLRWLSRLPVPDGVMVPKAESPVVLADMRKRLPEVPIIPLIESAAGYAAVNMIAATPGILRLAVGHIDFQADTGIQCSEEEAELAPLRFAVAMATRLGRLASALDGVTVAIQEDERLRQDTRRALRFGFGGKLCIHPRQVPVVHQVMTPGEAEIDWARRVLAADAASGGAAVQLDGRMIDLPVVLQAQRTLSRLRT